MSKLINNQFGKVCLSQNTDCEPIFVYTLIDDNGKTDDCEYAFVFMGDKIRLYGWHFGHDTAFTYDGNWMDNKVCDNAFHDHDYQDYLVERLRCCIKEVLDNIVGFTTEYL